MSLKASLISYLKGTPGLESCPIRFARSEQGDGLPRIVINQISRDQPHHMLARTGKATARMQFDCYGASPLEAMNTAESLAGSLDGFRGVMGDSFVSRCHMEDERDQETPPVDGADIGISTVQQDYMISWSVAVPTPS